jgi:hypothetical protein
MHGSRVRLGPTLDQIGPTADARASRAPLAVTGGARDRREDSGAEPSCLHRELGLVGRADSLYDERMPSDDRSVVDSARAREVGSRLAPAPRLLGADRHHRMGTWGPVFFVLWKGEVEPSTADRIRVSLRAFAQTLGGAARGALHGRRQGSVPAVERGADGPLHRSSSRRRRRPRLGRRHGRRWVPRVDGALGGHWARGRGAPAVSTPRVRADGGRRRVDRPASRRKCAARIGRGDLGGAGGAAARVGRRARHSAHPATRTPGKRAGSSRAHAGGSLAHTSVPGGTSAGAMSVRRTIAKTPSGPRMCATSKTAGVTRSLPSGK